MRVAIASESDGLREHLSAVLSHNGIEVVTTIPLEEKQLQQLAPEELDILLVDLDEEAEDRVDHLYELLTNWELPVLFNDSSATARSLREQDEEFGRKLSAKLVSLVPGSPPPPQWQH